MKILVTRTDRMGDVILSTPVAAALKKDIPGCTVSFLVRPSLKELLDESPGIDEILVDDREGRHSGLRGYLALVREAREKKFDASVVLFAEPRASFLPVLAGIPLRVGPLSRMYSPVCFNRPIRQSRSSSVKNEAEYNLDLLTALGCDPTLQPARICLKSDAVARVKEMMGNLGVDMDGKKIVIHPGSGGSGKNWTEDRYAQLAELILKDYDASIFFTGNSEEKNAAERIMRKVGGKTFSLCGRLTLEELAALLSQVNIFIGPSTGPLHLASAVGAPVIGLYSPVRCQRPVRWGPMGQGKKILLVPSVECPEAWSCDPACPFFDCFDRITPEDVVKAAQEII